MQRTEASPRPITRIEITPRGILYVLLAAAGVWLLVQLWEIVIVLIAALVLVGTLNPVVAALEQRGVRRGWAIALVFVAMLAALVVVAMISIPPLISQLTDLSHRIPELRARLVMKLETTSPMLAPLVRAATPTNSSSFVERAARLLLAWSPRIAEMATLTVTTLFLALYFIADRERTQGLAFALTPRRYHLRLARVLIHLETIVGGYVRGQVVTSLAMAVFTFVLLTVLRVPNAMALAVFAGVTDVLPFVGGLLATTPAVLSALTRGFGPATIVLVAMIVYQEFESRVLVPRVYGSVLRLSPAMVLVAVLIGGKLLGIVGALLAIPMAAGIQMLVQELRLGLPGDDIDDQSLRDRDEKAEQVYAARTEGAPAKEAAVVAVALATAIRDADAEVVGDKPAAAEVPLTGGEGDDAKAK